MESAGTLLNTEHETGLDEPGWAGVCKSFCNIDECIVKDYYCSSYSMLEYSFGSALPTILIRQLSLKDSGKDNRNTITIWIFQPYIDWPSAKLYVVGVAWTVASGFYMFCGKPLLSSSRGPDIL